MVSIFDKYIGQVLVIYLKNRLRYEGKVISVSNEGFVIIQDIKVGEKGIAISEISDYEVKEGKNGI